MNRLDSVTAAVCAWIPIGAGLATALILGCTSSSPRAELVTTSSAGPHRALQTELLAMAKRDQEYRKRGTDQSLSSEELQRVLAEGAGIDQANTARLKQIVAEHGWPDRRLVGEEGSRAAFILIQHADGDPAFQEQCLPLLERAAARGEIREVHVAYLTDRVRVKLGFPQLYGTQYRMKTDDTGSVLVSSDGLPTYLLPIVVDVEGLDARRKSMGLGPWYEYEKEMAAEQGREASSKPLGAAGEEH